MTNHTCTGKDCAVCAKKKTTMASAIILGIVILGGAAFLATRSDGDDRTRVAQSARQAARTDAPAPMRDDMAKGAGVAMEKDAMQDDAAVRDTMAKDTIKKDAMANDAMEKGGIYDVYAPEKVGVKERTILHFTATWCPSCQAFHEDVLKNKENIPANVAILRVDYDTNKALRKKYNVRTQHTYVEVDKDGAQLKTVVGSATLAALVRDFDL